MDNDESPSQSRMPEKPRKLTLDLQPSEEIWARRGEKSRVVENYPSLMRHDTRIAELYRVSSSLSGDVVWESGTTRKQKSAQLNPFHVRVDTRSRVWVNVMFERQPGVTLRALGKLMKIRAKTRRLISGRVLVENLPALTALAKRLRVARPISSQLYTSVPAIKANQTLLQETFQNFQPLDGSHTIIGIIDIGCDFNHVNFIKDNESRILFLWDQTGHGYPKPEPFGYGVEHNREKINEALSHRDDLQNDPYSVLGYKPDATKDGWHGTHVMDIAAGSSTQYPGVASGADIIFVHLGNPTASGESELKSLGSSTLLFDAVIYIFNKVDEINKNRKKEHPNELDIPVVINISLGANGGAHDGSSVLETMFDEMLNEKPGRAIVIAAGNSFEEKRHASGTIAPNEQHTLEWFIERKAPYTWDIRQELEIWYDKSAELRVDLQDPSGNMVGSCALDESRLTTVVGAPAIPVVVSHFLPDSEPGEDANHIDILFDSRDDNLELGIWSIHLVNVSDKRVKYNAWIEDNELCPSRLTSSCSTTATTLNAIGNAELPILVGANVENSPNQICPFSSAGPSLNPNMKKKPDICAPGLMIYAAEALSSDGWVSLSGTSMAAPHVTGVIALMFQAARDYAVNKRLLNIQEIRQFLLDTATPHDNPGHHNRYGFGIVNATDALKKII
jgi:subtilisin family serine protease